MSHRKKGELALSIADYEEAIKYDRESAYAYSGLAWIWATASDDRLRDGKKAVMYGQKGCELTAWTHPYSLNALAAAYAEVGRFDQAIRWQTKSLEFSEGFPKGEKEKAELRLKLYQAGQACRE